MYTMFSSFPLFSSSSLCSHTDRQSYASLIFNKSKMQLSTALRKCSEDSQSSRSNKRQQRVDTLRFRTPVMKGGRASNPRWEANSASCLDNSLRFFPSFSLQKLSWLSRISGVGLREWVHFLPRLLAFLMEVTFLSTDTCLFWAKIIGFWAAS